MSLMNCFGFFPCINCVCKCARVIKLTLKTYIFSVHLYLSIDIHAHYLYPFPSNEKIWRLETCQICCNERFTKSSAYSMTFTYMNSKCILAFYY